MGTRNGTPAARILCFARTSRFAIVASGTRKAAAISAVDSPHTARSVSATRASGASAGWQHMNTRASSSSRSPAGGPSDGSDRPLWSRIAAASFSPRRASRRATSTARRRATVTSHPAGLAGSPRSGHAARAATQASCTASSAAPRSPGGAGDRGHRRPPVPAQQRLDLDGQVRASTSTIGRTITEASVADGTVAAQRSASSRSAQSTMA